MQETVLTTSKFQIVEAFYALPGCCVSCGSPNGPALDTGTSTEEGAIVYCIPCAKDLGRSAGLVDPPNEELVPVAESLTRKELDDYLERFASAANDFNTSFAGLLPIVEEPSEPEKSVSAPVKRTRANGQNGDSSLSQESSGLSSSSINAFSIE